MQLPPAARWHRKVMVELWGSDPAHSRSKGMAERKGREADCLLGGKRLQTKRAFRYREAR